MGVCPPHPPQKDDCEVRPNRSVHHPIMGGRLLKCQTPTGWWWPKGEGASSPGGSLKRSHVDPPLCSSRACLPRAFIAIPCLCNEPEIAPLAQCAAPCPPCLVQGGWGVGGSCPGMQHEDKCMHTTWASFEGRVPPKKKLGIGSARTTKQWSRPMWQRQVRLQLSAAGPSGSLFMSE